MDKSMDKIKRMSKEGREFIFRDLSARLPYGVNVKVWTKDGLTEDGVLDLARNYGDVFLDAFYLNKTMDIKPYLRPMSSMTEEEKEYLRLNYFFEDWYSWNDLIHLHYHEVHVDEIHQLLDWFNAHHLDYRGLIEKGLALEALKGMYNIK